MTTSTNKDDANARSSAEIENPIAGQPPPVAVPHDASGLDLESRIRERRAALIDKLGALRGDVRAESVESRDQLKAKLSELAHIVKWGVVGGWANLGAPLTNKLEQWLAESARQLNTKHERP
ncbi:MAG TPA: hypothetical protein VIX73_25855 [Kofleriaceae bacterium]|jgi:hypothetical protein